MGKHIYQNYLDKTFEIIIDRPLGSTHPKHKTIKYAVNYGYIEGIIAGDDDNLDVYVLGPNEPLNSTKAKIIAIIHRLNDNEDKLVAATLDRDCTNEEIVSAIKFQEQYFKYIMIR